MKIAIYSPYLDSAGGGEKYMLTIAEALSEKSQVDVLLDANLTKVGVEAIKKRINQLHSLNLSRVKFISAPIGIGSTFFTRSKFLKKYDWLFYNSDGSIFFSSARNSVLHLQIPFQNVAPKGPKGWIKLKTWKMAIFNSKFTEKYILKDWPIKGKVIYPPVDIDQLKPLKKEKIILNVGRFISMDRIKKQHVMVEAFKQFTADKKGWSLYLAGGAREGDLSYVEELKKQAEGFDIHIIPNIDLKDLTELYGKATIYWHAMGYEENDPAKSEHFGISTVESMAAGCVPVVINKGGQTEIVEDGVSGLLWDSQKELVQKTLDLIEDPQQLQQLSKNALIRSTEFSKEHFVKNIKELVYGS